MRNKLSAFGIKKGIALSVIAISFATSSMAADIRTSGFINVVVGQNNLDSNSASTLYRGYNDKYDFQNESLAAIQFSTNFAEKMGATIQLIAQKNQVDSDIRMEWGYISYDATDELRILAGRIRPTLFLYSDYLDIGYAYNWVTPPSEVYDQASITNLDGVSATYNLELGENTLSLNMYVGNSTDTQINPNNSASPLKMEFDNLIGGEIALSNDYGKIRAGYIKAKVTETGNTVNPTTGTTMPSELLMNENNAAFYGVGISADYEDILFSAEYIERDMDETGAPDITSYYAMIGYKIGDITPSYTYANANSDMNFSDNTNVTVAGMVNTVRAGNLDDRNSHTINLRYDVNPKTALTLEYNMATLTHSAYAGGTTITETDEDVDTYRIALNIIF